MAAVRFGEELPDQFGSITGSLSAHLSLAHDLAGFLTERAALEREYAGKLQGLTRRMKEKRDKRLMETTVGAEPSKAWTEFNSR